ncbi:MAG TPA: T9SS type A sorting domain-containing protein [bacterium]
MRMVPIWLFCLALNAPQLRADGGNIVCGTQSGEIYFVGPVENMYFYPGFYYSDDWGQSIVLRDTVPEDYWSYGLLLADAGEQSLFLFCQPPDYYIYHFTNDGGYSWSIYDTTQVPGAFAGGVLPGELYKVMDEYHNRLERSPDYYDPFAPCLMQGFPDSLVIQGFALGHSPGEVFIYGAGHLYYSSDYAEQFADEGDISTAGVYMGAWLMNGASPGEVYAHYPEWRNIWRIWEYGDSVSCVADFTAQYGPEWECSAAAGHLPGELYFMAFQGGYSGGGLIQIRHSMDYGQSWQLYEHVLAPFEFVRDKTVPSSASLQVFPNPANPCLSISYNLEKPLNISFRLVNLLGQVIWEFHPGVQMPGGHDLSIEILSMPTGMYLLEFQMNNATEMRRIAIVK